MRWGGAGRHTSVGDEGRRGTPTPEMVAKSQNTHSSQGVGTTWTQLRPSGGCEALSFEAPSPSGSGLND